MPASQTRADSERERCYGCFRPRQDCFCDAIPAIENKTDILILQHARERFHPFNTARIVNRSLRKSELMIGHCAEIAAMDVSLAAGCGLLYPSKEATLFSDVQPEQRPRQLVVLDGTWHQAKTMFRDISWLRCLPRFKLAPEVPGRYRIRREPNATSLSTLEATVAALRALEPETDGFSRLIDVFDSMVRRQLTYPKTKSGWRSNARRRRFGKHIPRALAGNLAHVVVAYGEAGVGQRGARRGGKPPLYWVAERLDSGELFSAALRPSMPLSAAFLSHLKLDRQTFADAFTEAEFRTRWQRFLRPDDTLVVYHQSTARLLACVCGEIPKCLVLKSVKAESRPRNGTLEARLDSAGIKCGPVRHPGRAGQRLAMSVALTKHLNQQAKLAMHTQAPEF